MATRMSTAAILAMMDKRFGDSKKELLHKASIMENRSPEPRETIRTYDMQLEMKEKERLGIDFNSKNKSTDRAVITMLELDVY
ncbi:hypothetical protein PoB_006019400 [Plakobranchus ocellatus]|uniref:Uncharacterized protein n=1 Tax=Plakobranchus ocellatus TaxID=259542 RepID=A0AAV4CPA1_9GAST|nr:hypothetical protein PoB_006019400 [Plakobranchus ocellatus]